MKANPNKRRVGNARLIEKRVPVIVAASTSEFAKYGFHGATVNDIAAAAGVSVGMIYQYVNDKQGLLYLVISQIVTEYESAVERVKAADHAPLPSLLRTAFELAAIVDAMKDAARLGYRESRYLSREHLEDIKVRERRLGEFIAEQITACVSLGHLKSCNAEILAYQTLIFAQSWAVSVWRLSQISLETYVTEGIKLMYAGLATADINTTIAQAAQLTRPNTNDRFRN